MSVQSATQPSPSEEAVEGSGADAARTPRAREAEGDAPELLFATVEARDVDGHRAFAVPIACADREGNLTVEPRRCVAALGNPFDLRGTVTPTHLTVLPTLVPIPDRDALGVALDTVPDDPLLWVGRTGGRGAPAVDCRPETDSTAVPAMTSNAIASSGLGGDALAGASAFLEATWSAEAALETDLDGDGIPERLFAGEFANEAGPSGDCFVLVALWGSDPHNPTLVDLTCEDPTTGVLSHGGGPFNLEGSSCWDLNGDHVTELWLSTGYDSMREFRYVVVHAGRLEPAGGGYWFGD